MALVPRTKVDEIWESQVVFCTKVGSAQRYFYDLAHKQTAMIDEKILLAFDADCKRLEKGQVVFREGEAAHYYYQIREGGVKASNYNDQGREFIQGIFEAGQSFGEPALFGGFPYPSTAEALQPTVVFRLAYGKMMELLHAHFEVQIKFLEVLSKRLQYKSMIANELSNHVPEHRILTLLDLLKKENGTEEKYEVKLTRQKIADLTGLRVETVIRTINVLVEQKKLIKAERKIYR